MLEKTDGKWHCTDCNHTQADLQRLEVCPKCRTPLQTDKTRDLRAITGANTKFLNRVGESIKEGDDTQLRLTIKLARGRVVMVKVSSDEDWRLDNDATG